MRLRSRILILAVALARGLVYVSGGPLSAQTVEEDIRELQAILEEVPDSGEVRLLLGLRWMELEQFDEAEKEFRRLKDLCAESPTAINNLAVALAAKARYEDALRELSKIPDDPTAIDNGEAIGTVLDFWDPSQRLPDTDSVDLTLLDIADSCIRPPVESEEASDEGGPERSEIEGPAATEAAAAVTGADHRAPFEVVADWAAAWRAQDANAYLAHYSERFVPPGGISLDKWRARRQDRLTGPEFIELEIRELRNQKLEPGQVEVEFRQSYRSDTFQDVVRKTLRMALEEGGWRIVSERAD